MKKLGNNNKLKVNNMKVSKKIKGVKSPTVNVTINKSRLSNYKDKKSKRINPAPLYYLNNGQEFELEFFNPTSDTLLCDIYFNETKISNGGLVLNPGERIFLDRYLTTSEKFKFETYDVDNDNKEVDEAIKLNGLLKIIIYKESLKLDNLTHSYNLSNLYINTTTDFIDINHHYPWMGNQISDYTYDNYDNYNTNVSTLSNNTIINNSLELSVDTNKKETGRIGKGSISSQELTTVYKNWETDSSYEIEYKLLPTSQQEITKKDLVKKYCTNCGK